MARAKNESESGPKHTDAREHKLYCFFFFFMLLFSRLFLYFQFLMSGQLCTLITECFVFALIIIIMVRIIYFFFCFVLFLSYLDSNGCNSSFRGNASFDSK